MTAEQTLSFNSKVQDWSQIYHLTDNGRIYKASRVRFLPLDKVQQIETWRKDVSKTCRKSRSALKGKSEVWTLNDFNERPKSTGTFSGANTSGHWFRGQIKNGKVNFDSDMNCLTNNLAETSLHYASQRRGIYNNNTTPQVESIQINRKQVPDKADDGKVSLESTNDIDQAPQETANDNQHLNGQSSSDNSSEHEVNMENMDSAGRFQLASRGNTIHVKDKSMVSLRSCSNNLLNVVSVDDIKMTHFLRRRNTEHANSMLKSDVKEEEELQLKENSDKVSKNETNSSQNSRSGKNVKMNRTAKITHAIDKMVQDRKVMNSLDRNFDTRIGTRTRTKLDKPEGGPTFRRLNTALRKHVEAIAFNLPGYYNYSGHNSSINDDQPDDLMPNGKGQANRISQVNRHYQENEDDDEEDFGQCESETLEETASSFHTHDITENQSFAMETPVIQEELEEYEIDGSVT